MPTKSTSATLKKVAPDEPIFVLRARDVTAPQTVLAWVRDNPHLLNTPKGKKALNCVLAMVAWQDKHGCKAAD